MQRNPDTGPDGVVEDASREELYRIVRAAVEDAIRDVLGTVVLLGLSLVLLAAGASGLLTAGSATGVAVGAGLALAGLGLAAVALDLVPPR